MATKFNHTKAWHEMIVPAYKELPANLKTVLNRASDVLREKKQDRDSLDIPFDYQIKEWFAEFSSTILSRASYIVYNLGHWLPYYNKKESYASCLDVNSSIFHGGSWKVANVLDQILQERLEIPRARQHLSYPEKEYFYNGVFEGRLRVALATRHAWVWYHVCWADKKPELPSLPSGDKRLSHYWYSADKELEKWAKGQNNFEELNSERYKYDPDIHKVKSPKRVAPTSEKRISDCSVSWCAIIDHCRGATEESTKRIKDAGITKVVSWQYPKSLPKSSDDWDHTAPLKRRHNGGPYSKTQCGFEIIEVWFGTARRLIITNGIPVHDHNNVKLTAGIIPNSIWKKVEAYNERMTYLKKNGKPPENDAGSTFNINVNY